MNTIVNFVKNLFLNSFMASSRNRRSSARKRTFKSSTRIYGKRRWPLIIFMLLVCTSLIAFGAYRISRSSSGRNKSGNKNAPTAMHYPDLEIALGASPNNVEKSYEGFTVSFNRSNKTPDWVGWELLASETDGEEPRRDKFWQDFTLAGCSSPEDYRRSGYDKGHLCPAADQKWSASAMSDCFVMANMAPQDHALNAGAWKTLEEKERIWAQRDSALIIVAGPIYKENDKTTIGNGVRVPSAFFKVLLAPYLDQPRAIGFIYPNMRAPGNMADYSMSVDKVEEITGLDFFSSLPDEIENEIEQKANFNTWNRR